MEIRFKLYLKKKIESETTVKLFSFNIQNLRINLIMYKCTKIDAWVSFQCYSHCGRCRSDLPKTNKFRPAQIAPDLTSAMHAMMAPYLNMKHFVEPLTLVGLSWIRAYY